MRWATQELIHFDRVASAWLILRFVDPGAQFIFLAESERAKDDANEFGVHGSALPPHDDQGTIFQKLCRIHKLEDEALRHLGMIVEDAVAHVLCDFGEKALVSRNPHVGGMLALAEGILLRSASDHECLELSLPLYDALYTRLQVQCLMDGLESKEESILERTKQIAKCARALRANHMPFSIEAVKQQL